MSITFVIVSMSSYAQEFESILGKKRINCEDVYFNSLSLFPNYYEQGKYDSLLAGIIFIETKCGFNSDMLSIKILTKIKLNEFTEELYKGIPIIDILSQHRNYRIRQNDTTYNEYAKWQKPEVKQFDLFIVRISRELKNRTDLSYLELFFLDLYSDQYKNLFLRLQDSTFKTTKLKEDYDKKLKGQTKLIEGHFSLFTGMWRPIGNLSIVGSHPFIGLQLGGKRRKFMFDLTMDVKFLNSPNEYRVKIGDSLYRTNHFFGGYVAADFGYELFSLNNTELDIIAGCGWDGFDAVDIGRNNEPDRVYKTISSLNLNLGFGIRQYMKNRSYLGLDVKYNLVNFVNRGGTDLSGDVYTIRFKYGLSRNLYRDKALHDLDYPEIKKKKSYSKWLENPNNQPLQIF